MIIKPNNIFSNNIHCKGLFTFENAMANTAKNPLSGTWSGTTLYYNSECKFGTKSLDLSSMSKNYSIDFTPKIEQGTYISFWVYATSLPASSGYVVCFSDNGDNNDLRFYHVVSTGYFYFSCKIGGVITYSSGDLGPFNLNTWHFIQCYIVSANLIVMILDGKYKRILEPTNQLSFTTYSTAMNTTYYANVERQFIGYLDSLQIKTGCSISESSLYNIKNRES